MKKTSLTLLLGASGLLLSACGGDNDADPEVALGEVIHPLFDPSAGVLPFPHNLLFSGSVDGTLNIPLPDPVEPTDPRIGLNTLDGFSTVAPIRVDLSEMPAAGTLSEAVVLLRVILEPNTGAVTGVEEVLEAGEDYTVALETLDPNVPRLEIRPRVPLMGGSGYLVALTDELEGVSGQSASPPQTYGFTKLADPLVTAAGSSRVPLLSDDQARLLEPLRQLTQTHLAALAGVGVDPERVVLSWTFTTQSIGDVLAVVRQRVQAADPPAASLSDSGLDTPLGAADLYRGTLRVPYYLEPGAFAQDTGPLSGFWRGRGGSFLTRFNPAPVANAELDIPLLASVPRGTPPAEGWPVVVFVHGILRDRTDLQFIADTLAGAGLAALAIDLPLHGVTDSTSPFYRAGVERTFGLDLLDNATGVPGPDGRTDPTGAHYLNLASLVTARDNLRQGVADLLALVRALDGLDLDGDMAPDFDPASVRLEGYSLGGIIGGVALAQAPQIGSGVLSMAGGGIAKLLANSGRYGQVIRSGLTAAGIPPGTRAYEEFLAAAQTIVDSGDVINYSADATRNRGMLIQEIIGDTTIPNAVEGAPLSGTEPLARVMGLMPVGRSVAGNDLQVLVRLNRGYHGSLLDPRDPDGRFDPAFAAITEELQRQVAGFLASDGTRLPVTHTGPVQQP